MITIESFVLALSVISVGAPALYSLNSIVQLIRRTSSGAGFLSAVLSATGVLAAAALLIIHAFWQPVNAAILALLLAVGVVELLVGILLAAIVERRRSGLRPDQSFGLLACGMGLLTVVMVLFIPVLPGQFASPAATAEVGPPTQSPAPTLTTAPTEQASPTLTSSPLPTQTSTATSTPSATPTRIRYMTPTPSVTPTVAVRCGARVNYNLNMREAPSQTSDRLLVIPFESVIDVAGRNADATWWFVNYNETWGWVDGQYITLDTACADSPVIP